MRDFAGERCDGDEGARKGRSDQKKVTTQLVTGSGHVLHIDTILNFILLSLFQSAMCFTVRPNVSMS